jgi:MerR family transcriptional regulator/heat shock protein HspR
MYEQKGLVNPQRTAGNTRLYSDTDVERLQLIQRLTSEVGLNLAGVERVLHMEDELQRMHRRLERMEQEMRKTLEEVHRSYRRDLVLYRPPTAPVHQRRN